MKRFQKRVKNISYPEGTPEYEQEFSRIRTEAFHDLPDKDKAELKKFQPPESFSTTSVQAVLRFFSKAATGAIMCAAADKTKEMEEVASVFSIVCACYGMPDLAEDVKYIQTYIQVMHKILDAYKANANVKNSEIAKMEIELKEKETQLKKRCEHKNGYGKVQEAYKIMKAIHRDNAPSFRQFQKWIAGTNVPAGFPGISSIQKFAEWAYTWDKSQKKHACRPIGGMTDEEIYKKRLR